MKASTSILTSLAFAIFSVIKAALAQDPAAFCTDIACDACSESALWGIFPRAAFFPQTSSAPAAACFTSSTPSVSTIGCPCLFNAQTETPAIIGYQPSYVNGLFATEGYVQVVWTANDGGAVGGQLDVSVYSGWWPGQPGNEKQFPLIGSLGYYGVSAPTTESFSIISTLPDPITLDVVVTKASNGTANNAPLLINLAATYGDQNITFPWPIPSTTSQTMKAIFKIDVPVSEWWYADGLKVPYDS